MATFTYKSKGDQARALLLEGKSTTEAAETAGLAKGSVDMYFYKLKGNGDIAGTPAHPKLTDTSATALKFLQGNATPAKSEAPVADTPVTEEETKQEEVKAIPAVAPQEERVSAQTMADMAQELADTIARQKQAKDASIPNSGASLEQTMTDMAKKSFPGKKKLDLRQIEKKARKLTGQSERNIQRIIRLLRDNATVAGASEATGIKQGHASAIRKMLEENDMIAQMPVRGRIPSKAQASNVENLKTEAVPGVPFTKQLIIEKKLMQHVSPSRVAKDLKFSVEYVRKIESQLLRGDHIKPTLADVYGEATIQEVHVMLLQNKSPLLIANLLQVPVEVVEELAEQPVEGPFHEEAPKNTDPKLAARRLFLEGKNAIAIAKELPLSYQEVVDVFKELSQEGLLAGSAASPLDPATLENKKADAVKQDEPKFVEEEFADVHGVTHKQIALADDSVKEVTLEESVELGLIPGEIEVEPAPVGEPETGRVVTLEESVEEGLIPGELEVEAVPPSNDDTAKRVNDLQLEIARAADEAFMDMTSEQAEASPYRKWRQQLGERIKADAMQAATDEPFLKDRKEEQRKEQLQSQLDNIYHGDKDGDTMKQTDVPNLEEVERELRQEMVEKGAETLKLYQHYLTSGQFNTLLRDAEFLQMINDAKVHPIYVIADRLMKATPTEEMEVGYMLDFFRSVSHNALQRGEYPKNVANDLNIPLLFITLFHEVAENFTIDDIVAEPNGTLRDAVIGTTQAALDRRKAHEEQENRGHTINPNVGQEDTMLDISLTTTTALLKEKLDQHALLTDRQIKELQTETIVEAFDDFVVRVLKLDVEDFRAAVRRRYKEARNHRSYKPMNEAMKHAGQHLLENYSPLFIAEDYGIPYFDVIDLKEELQPKIDAAEAKRKERYAKLEEACSIVKSYKGYLTQQQYKDVVSNESFLDSLLESKTPMFDILHQVGDTHAIEKNGLFEYYEYIAGNTIDSGADATVIANTKKIPYAIVCLMQEFKNLSMHDVLFKKDETTEEFVLRTSRKKYEMRNHVKAGRNTKLMAFTGESVTSEPECKEETLDLTAGEVGIVEPDVTSSMVESIGFDFEPVVIPTKLAFGRKAVSVATVRKHIMKMLDMIELSGNTTVDVEFKISGGLDEERTDV